MARTKHALHAQPARYCPACRWQAMTSEQQGLHRERCRAATTARWRERHPDRAAVRDRLAAREAPGPCDRCGSTERTRAVVDYAAEAVTAWRCPPCWHAARRAWRLASTEAA